MGLALVSLPVLPSNLAPLPVEGGDLVATQSLGSLADERWQAQCVSAAWLQGLRHLAALALTAVHLEQSFRLG